MTLYIDNDDQAHLLDWAAYKIGLNEAWPDQARALAIRGRDDALRAVMVTVETYRGIIDVHFASNGARNWATRNILRGLFGYCFLVRRARRMQTIHSVEDKHLTSIILRMGFTVEGQVRAAIGPGRDGILFGMTVADCPWLDPQDKEAHHG